MSCTHWLSGRLSRPARPVSSTKATAAHRSCRPTLEALEQRGVPSTLTVNSTADSGIGSLRAALNAAHSGDTINFALPPTSQITLNSGELLIKNNMTIAGPGAGQLTISGNNASRVFEVAKNATVSLSGLTVSNGFVVSALAKSGYDTTNGRGPVSSITAR
jgi:hypothetical protein